jgi:uncharacterized protein YjbI with pentapeptide repeats
MQKITDKNYSEIIEQDNISGILFYGINFSWYDFWWKKLSDCKFEKCNLSNVMVRSTTFNNIAFVNSKIMWMKFVDINHFLSNFSFSDCNISLCSFYWVNLKNTIFKDSEIKESDFTNANLENASFDYCDLEKSIFSNTNLKNANFVWSYNFSINPATNKLSKTKFSRDNAIWLLTYLDITIE